LTEPAPKSVNLDVENRAHVQAWGATRRYKVCCLAIDSPYKEVWEALEGEVTTTSRNIVEYLRLKVLKYV
jgi:hypothetical protein